MDPVDVLAVAGLAAQMIRAATDPEEALLGAYTALHIDRPDDGDDPLVVRIVRLVDAAGADREKLIQVLSKQAGPVLLNRPPAGWGGAIETVPAVPMKADVEAEELVAYTEREDVPAREMAEGVPAFSVAERRIEASFGGRTIVVRGDERLSPEQAGEIQVGDSLTMEDEGLPTTVRGLIDYPLERPHLFTIHVGTEPWSIWDICCAFAEEYARIYENPEKYGIWGHDLSDLWIERLFYFPERKLIYPHIGS